jgi:hypothetical protein
VKDLFMNLAVFIKTIFENKKALAWWSLGLATYVLVNVAFYPDFKGQTEFDELLKSEAVKALSGNVSSFTSPEGYLNAQIFALVAPLLLIVYAVGRGTDAVAGEEGRGTLPSLLANPITRESVIWQKFAAMKTTIFLLAFVHFATLAALAPSFELDISLANQAAIGSCSVRPRGIAAWRRAFRSRWRPHHTSRSTSRRWWTRSSRSRSSRRSTTTIRTIRSRTGSTWGTRRCWSASRRSASYCPYWRSDGAISRPDSKLL